jgi:hypothetical protein
METKESRTTVVHRAIIGRSEFVELVIVAVLLAIGTNLVSDNIRDVIGLNHSVTLIIGISLCLAAIAYVGVRIFAGRTETRSYDGFLIYDIVKNEILSVPRYELGEAIPRYLRGAFSENDALRVLWDREPLRASGIDNVELLEADADSRTYVVTELRSFNMICGAVEYFLLDMLSTHLTEFFQDLRFKKQNLKTYGRQDLPDILLSNLFLELFSRPMDQRPDFVHETFEESILGEPWATTAASGAIYEKFDLVLPKDSNIRRGQIPHDIGQSRIEIETSKMIIALEVRFIGLNAWLPRGFLNYYLGVDEQDDRKFTVYHVDVGVEISLKPGALVSPVGWEYYHWIDSFLNRLHRYISKSAFLQQISWNSALTVLEYLNRERLPGVPGDDTEETQLISDLEELMVMSRFISFPLGEGPSRIFHGPSPCVLPVCFKNPTSSEYTYIIVGRETGDKTEHIISEPNLVRKNIRSEQHHQAPRWYQLTSDKPLLSIELENGPRAERFIRVQAEFHPIGTWNISGPVTIPADRAHAYALAITEQLGSSTWFVSIDDQEFTFDHEYGCHFVEFVLKIGQQHTLSLGYREGPQGIACAFFAF